MKTGLEVETAERPPAVGRTETVEERFVAVMTDRAAGTVMLTESAISASLAS